MKKIIVMSLTMLLSVSLLTGCGKKKENKPEETNKEPQTSMNNSNDVIKNQTVEEFSFTNTSLVFDNGKSTFVTSVTNTSSEVAQVQKFKIHVMKDDVELVPLTGSIGGSMNPGETRLITSSYGANITSATAIVYEIVR